MKAIPGKGFRPPSTKKQPAYNEQTNGHLYDIFEQLGKLKNENNFFYLLLHSHITGFINRNSGHFLNVQEELDKINLKYLIYDEGKPKQEVDPLNADQMIFIYREGRTREDYESEWREIMDRPYTIKF